MNKKKVIAVSGSNTGFGFSMIEVMCTLSGENAIVYLTASDKNMGGIQ